MSDSQESPVGIFASLRRFLDGGLALTQKRVELFAVELRKEKCRLVEAIILASAIVAFGMMTVALLTFLIVTLFWDSSRVDALLVQSSPYLVT